MFHVHGWIIDLEDETPLMDDYRINYFKFKLHQIYYLEYRFHWSYVGKPAPHIIKWKKWFHSWSCHYLGNVFKFKFIITFLHRKLHMDPVYSTNYAILDMVNFQILLFQLTKITNMRRKYYIFRNILFVQIIIFNFS
jgi:hypothetical protein